MHGSCESHLKLRQMFERGEEDIDFGICAFGGMPIHTQIVQMVYDEPSLHMEVM